MYRERRLGHAVETPRILILECNSIIGLRCPAPFVRPEIIKAEDAISRVIACTAAVGSFVPPS